MIRLVTLCDLHLSAHNPAAWRADYEATLAAMLREVWGFVEKAEARAILVAGDFFHLKAASRNPLGFLIRTSRLFAKAPCPVYGIAGNHDLRGGALANGGLEGQPLALLQETGAVILLDDRPVFLGDDRQCPGFGCWVQGASFCHGSANTFGELVRQDDRYPHIHLGHFGFDPAGPGDFFGEKVYGPAELGEAFDVAVIGHHHWDQGVQELGGRWYVAHGSFGWTSCHMADRHRIPKVGVIEVHPDGKINAGWLELPYQPFAELIDVEKRDAIQEETEQLAEFTTQLDERLLEAPDPEQVLRDLGIDTDVRERAQQYLEEAEHGGDS